MAGGLTQRPPRSLPTQPQGCDFREFPQQMLAWNGHRGQKQQEVMGPEAQSPGPSLGLWCWGSAALQREWVMPVGSMGHPSFDNKEP